MAKLTIQDVSREAGVSVATVSRVLNSRGQVSDSLRQQVLEAQERLGYSLPQKAVSLSRTIAVILPRFSNPFYNEILDGIMDTAARRQYKVVVSLAKSEYGYSAKPFAYLMDGSIDGVISLEDEDGLQTVLQNARPGLAIVQCCEYNEDLDYPIVAVNDYGAARNVISYLFSTGRRKIALLNSMIQTQYGRQRERGYRDMLAELGLPVNEAHIFHLSSIDLTMAYGMALTLLSENDRPDAIFAATDVYAIAATRAARELGIRVPEDIAIVGFDNIEMAAMNEPPLTTVNQPKYEIGSTACSMLIEQIEEKPAMSPRKVLLNSELIVRGSA